MLWRLGNVIQEVSSAIQLHIRKTCFESGSSVSQPELTETLQYRIVAIMVADPAFNFNADPDSVFFT